MQRGPGRRGRSPRGPRPRRGPLARALWYSGEAVLTLGLVLLLLVVHQLWWTNRQASAAAENKVESLEEEWAGGGGPGPDPGGPGPAGEATGSSDGSSGSSDGSPDGSSDGSDRPGSSDGSGRSGQAPGAPAPQRAPTHASDNHAYAVLRIPRLDLRVPVAEGVGKGGVLDKGYVGHYPRTAAPGRLGNFALAGHRNTHGEPFRHIDQLRAGDRMTVGTRDAVYTYAVRETLARTTPRDGGVIAPVPRSAVRAGRGFDEPGYYITLTTCTPEYTSRYRLVVWGQLTSVRPR
uniref:class E sortase n=1 Tax=Streptomyces aureocirculatus TaxID=67275 RepID=UPI00068DF40C